MCTKIHAYVCTFLHACGFLYIRNTLKYLCEACHCLSAVTNGLFFTYKIYIKKYLLPWRILASAVKTNCVYIKNIHQKNTYFPEVFVRDVSLSLSAVTNKAANYMYTCDTHTCIHIYVYTYQIRPKPETLNPIGTCARLSSCQRRSFVGRTWIRLKSCWRKRSLRCRMYDDP